MGKSSIMGGFIHIMFGGQWWKWWDIMRKHVFSNWRGPKQSHKLIQNCRRDQIYAVLIFQFTDRIRLNSRQKK